MGENGGRRYHMVAIVLWVVAAAVVLIYGPLNLSHGPGQGLVREGHINGSAREV